MSAQLRRLLATRQGTAQHRRRGDGDVGIFGGGGGDDDGAFAYRCADGMRKLPGKKWDSFAMEARARAPKGGLYSDGDEITLEFDRRRRELRVTDGRDGKAVSQRLKKDSVLAKTLDHDGEF